jgi:hypothetical protein
LSLRPEFFTAHLFCYLFHDPKNLAEALSIEAGELLENFPWKTTELTDITITREIQSQVLYLSFNHDGATPWI